MIRKIYIFSCVYDILAALLLTNPFTYPLMIGLLVSINAALGLPGLPVDFSATHTFFANIGGLSLCVWAIARFIVYNRGFLVLDAGLKIALVLVQIYAVAKGAPVILLVLGTALFLIGVAELFAYARGSVSEAI